MSVFLAHYFVQIEINDIFPGAAPFGLRGRRPYALQDRDRLRVGDRLLQALYHDGRVGAAGTDRPFLVNAEIGAVTAVLCRSDHRAWSFPHLPLERQLSVY